MKQDVVQSTQFYNQLPSNPNLYQETCAYKDSDLTLPAGRLGVNQPLLIKSLVLNKESLPVFELADGTYVEANRQLIYDDIVLNQVDIDSYFWTQKKLRLYSAPYVLGTQTIPSSFSFAQKVHATQMAQTNHGTYYLIDDKGWASQEDLVQFDNRMLKVQEMLLQKYNNPNYSIFVKQLNTQTSAGINADKKNVCCKYLEVSTTLYCSKTITKKEISRE